MRVCLFPESGGDSEWRTIRGKFLAINAASMSCACPRSPKGLSPAAHLADGTTDLILVRKCSRFDFLRHLLRHTSKDDQVMRWRSPSGPASLLQIPGCVVCRPPAPPSPLRALYLLKNSLLWFCPVRPELRGGPPSAALPLHAPSLPERLGPGAGPTGERQTPDLQPDLPRPPGLWLRPRLQQLELRRRNPDPHGHRRQVPQPPGPLPTCRLL